MLNVIFNNKKMSNWRKIALEKIPSQKQLIQSKEIDTSGMLWIELDMLLENKDFQEVGEIFNYAKWCLKESGNDNIRTVVFTHFYEHLLEKEHIRKILPNFISKGDFTELKDVFLYHNSEEDYEKYRKEFWDNWEKINNNKIKKR
jgi:hypothetical protein